VAQYGHNWYGTSYYGQTNAFSGWYQTREIFTEEALKNTVTINMKATLPSATYGPQSAEVQQIAGTWTYDASLGKLYSNSTNAQLYMAATCDFLKIKYEQRTIGAKVNVEITTTLPGQTTPTVTNYVLNTQASTVNANAEYVINNLPFGQQQIKITMATDSPAGANFNFKGFVARTAHLTVESRARLTYDPEVPMEDSEYAKLTTTITPISGDEYTISAVTPSYVGRKYVQFKVYLASSDNETTPEVQHIELVAGDTNNRTEDGKWSVVFNMEQIAILKGVSFSKVEEVIWTETVPSTTSLTIRSQSSTVDNYDYWEIEKSTVPYKKDTKRIRLKDGFNSGWIDTPFITPTSNRPYVSTVEWVKWDDQSFLPPDRAGVGVTYDFISVQKDNTSRPYVTIREPMDKANRNLAGNPRLRNLDHVIRIRLSRTSGKQTPVVDWINLESKMYYQQDVAIEAQEFSAVDFNNTGRGIVLDTDPASFRSKYSIPPETSNPTYELIDDTRRPQDVVLYLDTEKDLAIRTNKTNTLVNKVWAEAKAKTSVNSMGLQKHYQYGGGQVKFPLKDEIQLAPTFTPSLNSRLRYRYHLESGWPEQYHTVVEGDTLEDVAIIYGYSVEEIQLINPKVVYVSDGTLMPRQKLAIPNDSENTDVNLYWKSTMNERTSKSSQNAILEGNANVESDSVVAEVSEASIYGWVDWVSEEKIYDGVVNPNDVRREYKRTHSSPDSGNSAQVEYVAVASDTYKKIAERFGVYEEDVRRLNGVTVADEQPIVGQKVLVPSRIVLPSILPQAVVQDNPYHIEIVYNSVKKKNGKTLTTSAMTVSPISITYREVSRETEITRGDIANGKDVLPSPRVTRIDAITSQDGMVVYNEWDDDLQIGNFKLDGNYIDWSPSETEPAAGATYIVRYYCEVPDKVTVTIDTTYQEEGGVDRIWRSPEVKEFKGMCYPGKDYIEELPSFNNWIGLPDNNVEDIQYIVEDNDIWVKTWIEKRDDGKWYIIGSLQDRVPKDNWLPTMKTGYYYLGKDEYYMFNEPIVIEPTEKEIPIAENVDFVTGKFQNAARLQEGSENLILNSGFDILTEKKTVFKLTF
jgi:LysM repeat protein